MVWTRARRALCKVTPSPESPTPRQQPLCTRWMWCALCQILWKKCLACLAECLVPVMVPKSVRGPLLLKKLALQLAGCSGSGVHSLQHHRILHSPDKADLRPRFFLGASYITAHGDPGTQLSCSPESPHSPPPEAMRADRAKKGAAPGSSGSNTSSDADLQRWVVCCQDISVRLGRQGPDMSQTYLVGTSGANSFAVQHAACGKIPEAFDIQIMKA